MGNGKSGRGRPSNFVQTKKEKREWEESKRGLILKSDYNPETWLKHLNA